MGVALMLQGDYEGGLAEARRALAISPNLAHGHADLGTVLLFSGCPREAMDATRRGLRLDLYDPFLFIRWGQIGTSHYLQREYNEAVEVLKETIRSYPHHARAHYRLAAALGQLGLAGEAQVALQKAIAITPKFFDIFARHRPHGCVKKIMSISSTVFGRRVGESERQIRAGCVGRGVASFSPVAASIVTGPGAVRSRAAPKV
jgi:tetratricopeptide (TPR) repeat protein